MITNPVSGQTVTFLSMTHEILRTRFDVASGHASDPRHVHPLQTESISVIEGRIRCKLPDGGDSVLGPGDHWNIQPGSPHTWTAIDPQVTLRIDFRPAMRTRRFMTRLFGLASAGKVNSKGIPNLLQVAVLGLEYQSEFRLASPPWGVQKPALTGVARVARLLGYQP